MRHEIEETHNNIETIRFHIEGLERRPIAGDDLCLYEAIALCLDESAQSIRDRYVAYLETNRAEFEGTFPLNQYFDEYLNGIRTGEPADRSDIPKLMTMLNRAIIIFYHHSSRIDHLDNVADFEEEPIFLYDFPHHGNSHYDSLVLSPVYRGRAGQIVERLCLAQQQKKLLKTLVCIFNGMLYYSLAFEGGSALLSSFNVNGEAAYRSNVAISACTSLVYGMFWYIFLGMSSELKDIDSYSKVGLLTIAPFAALAFLTGGMEGAELLGFNQDIALFVGILLFCFRAFTYADAAIKFPARLTETRNSWNDSLANRDYSEIARLAIVWLNSLCYAASTTDSIYNATTIILSSFSKDSALISRLSYLSAGLGAIAGLPLFVFISHVGLRQLTYASNHEGRINTDVFTYIGAFCVLPSIFGALGGASGSSGHVYGLIGHGFDWIRVVAAIAYALFAGTPGMAHLIREAYQSCRPYMAIPSLGQDRPAIISDTMNPLLTEMDIEEGRTIERDHHPRIASVESIRRQRRSSMSESGLLFFNQSRTPSTVFDPLLDSNQTSLQAGGMM